ncbi:ATP-binding protein [Clostridiaceae bacterium HSG29]|nr:ATP-binding protein [Clostridiaceae bacterium HSG29]
MKVYYDLHIHSCLSPCADNNMTPNNIVHMAMLKELDIIAITDHNSLLNVETAMKIGKECNIVVIPGVEVQTIEEVHMVCLFKDMSSAKLFNAILEKERIKIKNRKDKFGDQLIVDENDNVIAEKEELLLTSINISVKDLYLLVNKLDGAIFPAHVDRNYASIITNLGFIPDEYNFRYVEISKGVTSKKYLSDIAFKNKYYILRNSDAHNLGSINEPIYSIELEEKTIECFIDEIKRGSYMKELSLHILDIARNSIVAEAKNIRISIIEDSDNDKLIIKIKDDGKGMDEHMVENVVDPFFTTRTTRDVGLGIPLFKANAENCDGEFIINSDIGIGTEITAKFKKSHIDRAPLGNMADTIITIINANIDVDLIYTHEINKEIFTLNTKEIKKHLGEIMITNLDVLVWLKSYIAEGLEEINNEI